MSMEKCFKAFAERRGIGLDRYRFSVHGKRISMACTPQSLGLKDRDRIDCYSLEDRLEDCARRPLSDNDAMYFVVDKHGKIRFSNSDRARCASELAFFPADDESWVIGPDVPIEFFDRNSKPPRWRRGLAKRARRFADSVVEDDEKFGVSKRLNPFSEFLGYVSVQPLMGGACIKLERESETSDQDKNRTWRDVRDLVKQDQRTSSESLEFLRSEVLRISEAEAGKDAKAEVEALLAEEARRVDDEAMKRAEAEKAAEAAAEALLAEEANSNHNGKSSGGGGNGTGSSSKKIKKAKAKEKEQAAERRRHEREAERRAAEKADRDAQIAAVDARRR